MKSLKNLMGLATVGIILSASIATAANYQISLGNDTQDLISQNMAKKMKQAMAENIADPALSGEIQNSMSSIISDAIKLNTATRKRASVVQTCMECRVGKPIKVVISGKVDILDTDTQVIINQNMAKMVAGTIRENSSDPAVARIIQEEMMGKKMQGNALREQIQPMMQAEILGSALVPGQALQTDEIIDTAALFNNDDQQPQS